MSLLPKVEGLRAVVGGDFEETIKLFEDEAKTKKFNLTGWKVTLYIGGATYSSGSGLTITAAEGKIEVHLTAAQVGAAGSTDYHLEIENEATGRKIIPLGGAFNVKGPAQP